MFVFALLIRVAVRKGELALLVLIVKSGCSRVDGSCLMEETLFAVMMMVDVWVMVKFLSLKRRLFLI